MYTLEYQFKENIPVFKCNLCGKCQGVPESTSHMDIKNRGCCWYFPKYTLADIKNILLLGKRDFILGLPKMENANVSQYFIEMKGTFYKKKYEEYLSEQFEMPSDFNEQLFFRLCPFCGFKGCMISFDLRPHPCNLYLCRQVINLCGNEYKAYSMERKDYYSYCNYFNEGIKAELMENKVDLIIDFEKSLGLIDKFDMPPFEPRDLKPINFSFDGNYIPA